MSMGFRHYKQDPRPQKGGWAPGEYTNQCRRCHDDFIGDKRAWMCADCEYPEELKAKEFCRWSFDEDHCKYDTECHKSFYFEDGDRFENNVRFCHYCGGLVTDVEQKEAE